MGVGDRIERNVRFILLGFDTSLQGGSGLYGLQYSNLVGQSLGTSEVVFSDQGFECLARDRTKFVASGGSVYLVVSKNRTEIESRYLDVGIGRTVPRNEGSTRFMALRI